VGSGRSPPLFLAQNEEVKVEVNTKMNKKWN